MNYECQAPVLCCLLCYLKSPGLREISRQHLSPGEHSVCSESSVVKPSRDRQPGLPCALPDPKDSACRNGQTGQAGVWSWPIDAREGSWQDQMVIQQAATSVLLPSTSDY